MVTQIPQVTNWSVTPQNGQVGYFALMNTWLFESTTVIDDLNTVINKINQAGQDINSIGESAINAVTFENIAELKLNSNINRIDVLGYYDKGDGGGGTFYWDSTSTETDNDGTIIQATGITTGRWKRVYSGAVNVKWFGAVGDGVADDTVAIQKTVNNYSDIYIPKGTFRTTGTINSSIQALRLVGHSSYSSQIILDSTDDVPVFIVSVQTSTFKQLRIGGTSNSINTAIKFTNLSNKDDIDAKITDCHLYQVKTCIDMEGRGLFVNNCILSTASNGIIINRNTNFIAGPENDQTLETGMRAYCILDCRFHGIQGYAIRNQGTNQQYVRGILFDSNYIDTGCGILIGTAKDSIFTNNVSIYGAVNIFYNDSAYPLENVTISSNAFSYLRNITTPNYNTRILYVSGVKGLVFTNNNIVGIRNSIAYFTNNVEGLTFLSNSIDDLITSNSIIHLSSGKNLDKSNISNNTIINSDSAYFIDCNGTVEDTRVSQNTIDSTYIALTNNETLLNRLNSIDVEIGSNANGTYLKYSDGTLHMRNSVTSSVGGTLTISMPMDYISANTSSMSWSMNSVPSSLTQAIVPRLGDGSSPDLPNNKVQLFYTPATSITYYVSIIARWK